MEDIQLMKDGAYQVTAVQEVEENAMEGIKLLRKANQLQKQIEYQMRIALAGQIEEKREEIITQLESYQAQIEEHQKILTKSNQELVEANQIREDILNVVKILSFLLVKLNQIHQMLKNEAIQQQKLKEFKEIQQALLKIKENNLACMDQVKNSNREYLRLLQEENSEKVNEKQEIIEAIQKQKLKQKEYANKISNLEKQAADITIKLKEKLKEKKQIEQNNLNSVPPQPLRQEKQREPIENPKQLQFKQLIVPLSKSYYIKVAFIFILALLILSRIAIK